MIGLKIGFDLEVSLWWRLNNVVGACFQALPLITAISRREDLNRQGWAPESTALAYGFCLKQAVAT